ncbi:MAG TPA: YuzL family protein [Bacillus bacterium]|nr:YuzL family protein [Bacillus sp. (in: firmicutes)]
MPRETKADPTTIGLGSADVEGQGTTTKETGKFKKDSSRGKKRKKSGIL